jgi:hypothetical protein
MPHSGWSNFFMAHRITDGARGAGRRAGEILYRNVLRAPGADVKTGPQACSSNQQCARGPMRAAAAIKRD